MEDMKPPNGVMGAGPGPEPVTREAGLARLRVHRKVHVLNLNTDAEECLYNTTIVASSHVLIDGKEQRKSGGDGYSSTLPSSGGVGLVQVLIYKPQLLLLFDGDTRRTAKV
jgi:hypothetical protein